MAFGQMSEEKPKAATTAEKIGSDILEIIRKGKLITAHCSTCQQPVALIHSPEAREAVGRAALASINARTDDQKQKPDAPPKAPAGKKPAATGEETKNKKK